MHHLEYGLAVLATALEHEAITPQEAAHWVRLAATCSANYVPEIDGAEQFTFEKIGAIGKKYGSLMIDPEARARAMRAQRVGRGRPKGA